MLRQSASSTAATAERPTNRPDVWVRASRCTIRRNWSLLHRGAGAPSRLWPAASTRPGPDRASPFVSPFAPSS